MARGAYRPLILAGLLAAASTAVAQNPPAAPPPSTRPDTVHRDTLARVLVLNEVYAPGPSALAPSVVLEKGTVYRIEIQPGAATVSVRPVRQPGAPPMFLVPLEGVGGVASQMAAYLMVPPATQEYRFDVTSYESLVTLRVWTDPRESARFTRMHTEGFRLPVLALGVAATYLAPFRDARSTSQDALLGYTTTPQGAWGAKLCLDVLPNGRLLPDRTGGCALALTLWQRGAGRNFFTFGIEPEVVVARGSLQEIALTPQLAIGNTTGGRPYASYVFYGLGVRCTVVPAGMPRLGFQAQANLLELDSKPNALDPSRVNTLTLSLAAGVLFKL